MDASPQFLYANVVKGCSNIVKLVHYFILFEIIHEDDTL